MIIKPMSSQQFEQQRREREFNAWFLKTLRSDKKYHKVRVNCRVDDRQLTGLVCELTDNEVREILIHGEDVEFVGIKIKKSQLVLPDGWR